jgi:RNA polymerase primary sigma factor
LVLRIANDFIGRGLPWDDLVSEGNMGLMTAAHRYDPNQGAQFSTYSSWWIKQAIRQALAEQVNLIRIPVGTQVNSRRIRRAVKELTEASGGKNPTDEEVADYCKLPLVTVNRLRNAKLAEVQSLNASISSDDPEGAEFQDFISDSSPGPDQEMIKVEDIEQLLELIDSLNERERQVIKMRFGLNGEPLKTLEEVGKVLGCTNERVRQIQNQALLKLRNRLTKQ